MALYFPSLHKVSSFLWSESKSVSHSVVSDSLRPHGLWPSRRLYPWDSLGQNTGMGCHALLRGIFLTQGSNLGLLPWQADSSPAESPGKPSDFFRDVKNSWVGTAGQQAGTLLRHKHIFLVKICLEDPALMGICFIKDVSLRIMWLESWFRAGLSHFCFCLKAWL